MSCCVWQVTLKYLSKENAIGPAAFRNDDILTMYSQKTVEVILD
jgi:leucyl aminopeptidase